MRPIRHCLPLFALLLLAAGCGPDGPNAFLIPGAETIHPPGARLVVRPTELLCSTRTQQVLIATVYDAKDQPRRQRRVEWHLEGVGQLLEVDENAHPLAHGRRDDSRSAITYTDLFEHTFDRGTKDPTDDFTIRPGQTWCVLSSAQEGTSQITVYCPEISDWGARQVTVTINWVDSECVVPPAAVERAGGSYQLSTKVLRRSDKHPQANYRVRYRLLDGPPCRLLAPTGVASGDPSEAVAISDGTGSATITLSQRAAQAGVNRIAVEVVRPPTQPGGAEVIVARRETKLEWLAPQVSLALSGPNTAALGQEMPFTLTLRSTGPVETPPLTVRQKVPAGWKLVRSDPPVTPEGDEIIWTLAGLPKNGNKVVQAVFVAAKPGHETVAAEVSGSAGLRAQSEAPVSVAVAQLKLTLTGPASAAVGDALTYQLKVANGGVGPAANVMVRAGFDAGLEHESKANPLEMVLETLAPGQVQTVPLVLTTKQAGRLALRVAVTAAGGLSDHAECVTEVRPRAVGLALTGPERVYAEREATWDIQATNSGAVPLTNVLLRFHLPPEMEFRQATENGQYRPAEGGAVWYLGTLAPGAAKAVKLTATARTATARALSTVTVSADGVPPQSAEHGLEIVGVPALALDVIAQSSTVSVGATTAYTIRATNRGTLTASGVELAVMAPDGMKLKSGHGPGEAKLEGPRLTFAAVESLPPGKTVEYQVEAQAVTPGDQAVKVEARSRTLQKPVEAVEVTRVLSERGASAP